SLHLSSLLPRTRRDADAPMNAPTKVTYRSTRASMVRRRGVRNSNSREGCRRSNTSAWFFSSILLVLLLGSRDSAASAEAAAAAAAAVGGANRCGSNPETPPAAAAKPTAKAHRFPAAARKQKGTGGRAPYQVSAGFATVSRNSDESPLNMPRIAVMRRPEWLSGGEGHGLVRDLKMAVAGALAGAIATAALFPIDTAKTLRQANPKAFKGTRDALGHICRTRGPLAIYTGIPTAVVGAMPSSALYFGTYEAVKTRLMRVAANKFPANSESGGGGGGGGGRGG
ncbi:unnamed protein product, partial [Pylaiella littoralis]